MASKKTIAEIQTGKAECFVVRRESEVVGLIIEKPKADRLKIATLWIAPEHRGDKNRTLCKIRRFTAKVKGRNLVTRYTSLAPGKVVVKIKKGSKKIKLKNPFFQSKENKNCKN